MPCSFPDGSDSKASVCNVRQSGFNPWVGKIPWRRKWQPPPVFLSEEFHGQRGLVSYSPWGHKESDTTEWLTHTLRLFYWTSSGFFPVSLGEIIFFCKVFWWWKFSPEGRKNTAQWTLFPCSCHMRSPSATGCQPSWDPWEKWGQWLITRAAAREGQRPPHRGAASMSKG